MRENDGRISSVAVLYIVHTLRVIIFENPTFCYDLIYCRHFFLTNSSLIIPLQFVFHIVLPAHVLRLFL